MASLYLEHETDIKTAIAYLKKAEAIAEADNNSQLLQLVYINLTRLYNLIKEFELAELYNKKLLSVLGFGGFLGDDEE